MDMAPRFIEVDIDLNISLNLLSRAIPLPTPPPAICGVWLKREKTDS